MRWARYAYPDANGDSYSDVHAYRHRDDNAECISEPDSYRDIHAYTYRNGNGHTNRDSDTNSYGYINSYGGAVCDAHLHTGRQSWAMGAGRSSGD